MLLLQPVYYGSPAYAGIDPVMGVIATVCVRFPRLRGDRPYYSLAAQDFARVPPPTRG